MILLVCVYVYGAGEVLKDGAGTLILVGNYNQNCVCLCVCVQFVCINA